MEQGSNRLLHGVVLAAFMLALILFLTATGAWFLLKLPLSQYDPLLLPRFFWYYRHDPAIHDALGLAALFSVPFPVLGFLFLIKPRHNLHGDAHFASERDIRKAQMRASKGIVLGRAKGRYLVFGGSEHVLMEAPTRSGKGVGVVIPNLLSWPDSVVVLDIKQENFAKTAGYRAAAGQKVILFNPAARDGRTACYNPLAYIDRTDPAETLIELQKIATMLFCAADGADSFWTESARIGFIGIGGWVASQHERPFSFGEIYRSATMPGMKAFFTSEALNHNLPQGVTSALADFTNSADNTFSGIVQTITSRLNLWVNPLVDRATETSDFSLAELRRRPTSIYLGVSPDELSRVAPLYSLLFQQLIDSSTRTLPEAKDKLQILVILDEFARLGRAQMLADAFSYVAGYGVRLLPVIQSRTQLRHIYGADGAEEIMTNCGAEVVFTPKQLNVSEEISKRLGYLGMQAESRSLTIHGLLANRSKTLSRQQRALMLPQEVRTMADDALLVFRSGIPAIKGRKIRYFRDAVFRKRVRPAPNIPPLKASLPLQPDELHDLTDEELAAFNDTSALAETDVQALPQGVLALEELPDNLTVKDGLAFDTINFDDILGPDPLEISSDDRQPEQIELILEEGEDHVR